MKITYANKEDFIIHIEAPAPESDFVQNPVVVLQPRTAVDIDVIVGEIPNGTINGSNATFTTDYSFIPETVQVFRNGIAQYNPTHFTTSGTTTITLNFSPIVGDILTVNYIKA